MRQLTPKPLFESSTVRGVTASAVATIIIGILPFAQSIGNRHCRGDEICQSDVSDIVEIISVVVTTIGLGSAGFAVVGRASIGDLWTPRGVPGPSQEELVQEIKPWEIEPDDDDPIRGIEVGNLPLDTVELGSSNGRGHSFSNRTIFDDPMEGIR